MPKGIMRSAVPLPCFFDEMKLQRVAGQQPQQGTKSCRMGRNSVCPSIRPSPLWLALRPCWLALRLCWQALRPLHLALRPLPLALRTLWVALRPIWANGQMGGWMK